MPDRTKATLILDPRRRAEQLAFVAERAETIAEVGDQLWVAVTDDQAQRLADQGITVQLHPEADWVELPATTFDPLVAEPVPPPDLRAADAPAPGGYQLVQFVAPPAPAWIAAVIDAGGTFVQTIPPAVAVFRLPGAAVAAVRASDRIRWVGPFHPAYAISYSLTGSTAWLGPVSTAPVIDPERLPADDEHNLDVRLFDDLDGESVRAAIEAAGATVRSVEGETLSLTATAGQVPAIARVPGVFAIGPAARVAPGVQRGGIIIGANQVRNVGAVDFLVNLDGTGEIASIVDSGLDTGAVAGMHADLAGRVLLIGHLAAAAGTPVPDNVAAGGPHGTHVTGTIAGNGTLSAGRVRGIAPNASVIFHGPIGLNYRRGWTRAHADGARVHNNSWGDNLASVSGNNLYTTAGAFSSLAIDRFCHAYPDSLFVFITQNYEADVAPPAGALDATRLTQQSTTKNAFVVGAVENVRNNDGFRNSYRTHPDLPGRYANAALTPLAGGAPGTYPMSDNADEVALFSNRGVVQALNSAGLPVPIGRVRPDIVAPGTNILAARSSVTPVPTPAPYGFEDPATEAAASYLVLSGTSMAAPHVTGAAIVTRQFYRARFGQLRRPLLLDGVAIPAAAPLPAFVDAPALAPRMSGVVAAWVPPGVAGAVRTLAAVRLAPEHTVLDAPQKQLQGNVGDQPSPKIVRHGDRTLLVHRARDASVQIHAYDAALAAEAGFGTGGTVTLAPLSRLDADRPLAALVTGDQIAVAWPRGAGDDLHLQRFDARTGAPVDANALTLGTVAQASPQGYLAHDGTRYAAAWVDHGGAGHRLQLRLVDAAGVVGAQPVTLLDQAADLRDPHIAWDARAGRYAIVWCDARTVAGGDVRFRLLDAQGAPQGAEVVCANVPAAAHTRRPHIAVHPRGGYVLAWEDDSQNGHYDVYVSFLDATGNPDARIPADPSDASGRALLRLSDTPDDTQGFAVVVDADGVAVLWQSRDEINSDRLGVYLVGVTLDGAFRAQADPATPLLRSGRYVTHTLLEHTDAKLVSCALAHAGGTVFHARYQPGRYLGPNLHVVRTDSDGRPDPAYGPDGAREAGVVLFPGQLTMHWTGTFLVLATSERFDSPRIRLMDATGTPVAAFGTAGERAIDVEAQPLQPAVAPAIAHHLAPALRILVVYGTGASAAERLRYAVLDGAGGVVTAPRTLANATGTARHRWFGFATGEMRSAAVFHRAAGPNTHVFANRFNLTGVPQHAVDLQISAAVPGDSMNGSLALRPTDVNSPQREYGVVWQNRPAPAADWELRFSRLDRNASPRAAPPVPGAPALPPPVVPTKDVRVIFPGAAGWPAGTHATEPQIVSTFTHEPWASPLVAPAGTAFPAYSPGYGLAWLGQPTAGGPHTLYFTVLDENGSRLMLPQPPPAARALAPITQVSAPTANVQEFDLTFNGRSFRLAWTEVEAGKVRHVQAALSRDGGQAVYGQPSGALLRATLINGATNIRRTSLPNVNQPAPGNASGYGWGRVNLRQSLAPAPPITFQVRDDIALGPGRSARYRFTLPPGTKLLRATLAWCDPPAARVVNRLHLLVTPPGGGNRYQGNTWSPAPNSAFSRLVAPGTALQTVHNTEQVVVRDPPPGVYGVEIVAENFGAHSFNQLNLQPFSLVFVGSGEEVRFGGLPAVPLPIY